MRRATPCCTGTRREFLWQSGRRLRRPGPDGAARTGRLLRPPCHGRRAARRCASPLASRQPHFPAKAKHCIFLFMYGGPSRSTPSTTSPSCKSATARRWTSRSAGAPCQKQKLLRLAAQVRRSTASRASGARDAFPLHRPAHGRAVRPQEPVCRHLRPRLGDDPDEHRPDHPGLAVARLVAGLRPGHRRTRTCPATWSCSIRAAGRSPGRPTGRAASCRPPTRARTCATRASRSSTWPRKSALSPRRPARPDRHPQRPQRRAPARPARLLRIAGPHRQLRAGLPAADDGPGGDGPVAARTRRRWRCTACNEPKPTNHRLAWGPAHFGRQCLIARRLVERGVRFVQIYSGGGHNQENWDAHNGVEENLLIHGPEIDRPIHALLTDLKRRGLLDETLVVWGGEFGRQPVVAGQRRPRPQPQGLHLLAGRRRRQGRHQPRRDRRVRPRGGRRSPPHPRPARHHPAPDGAGPPQADVLLRRPATRS